MSAVPACNVSRPPEDDLAEAGCRAAYGHAMHLSGAAVHVVPDGVCPGEVIVPAAVSPTMTSQVSPRRIAASTQEDSKCAGHWRMPRCASHAAASSNTSMTAAT
jgi:hypothetical protein